MLEKLTSLHIQFVSGRLTFIYTLLTVSIIFQTPIMAAPENNDLTISPTQLELLHLESISPQLEESIISIIKGKICEQCPFTKIHGRASNLILMLLEDFTNRSKIVRLTADIRSQLGANHTVCRNENGHNSATVVNGDRSNCYIMPAFYLPSANLIFIDINAFSSKEELARVLFHEIVHAYQWTYSLPVDLISIERLIDAGMIDPTDAMDYLNFLYEGQAHWYTMQAFPDPSWIKIEARSIKLSAAAFAKAALSLITLVLPAQIAHRQFNLRLPLVDRRSPKHLHYDTNKGQQRDVSELLVLRNRHNYTNLAVSIDISFHKKFSEKIENAYFGGLNFLLSPNDRDQLNYVSIHNAHHQAIQFSNNNIFNTCNELFTFVSQSKKSPMYEWLNMEEKKVANCALLNSAEFASAREKFKYRLPRWTQSPFNIKFYGGEGSGGDFLINPQLLITARED